VDNPKDKGEIIRNNYERVRERIDQVALEAGRHPSEISLVVVTKTHPVDVIRFVVEAGATDLGENYVEEAVPKIQALAKNPDIRWHMIGHVQSRKAEEVCRYFQYIHSVDSVKLAERLSRFASGRMKPLPVWIEFNVAGEATKSGWNIAQRQDWITILPDMEKIFNLPNLDFLGVMSVPPYSPNPDDSRPFYRLLSEFQKYVLHHLQVPGFAGLSMGMSNDFEVAIQEGSTCVRIGQAILGPRY
jgi:pyridoxal phosphate enzyme (YggS family)